MKIVAAAASTAIVAGVLVLSGFQASAPAPAKAKAPASAAKAAVDPLLEGFKKATVASVSDAVDQITGQRGFMSHEMRPRVPGQIVGRAITAHLRQARPEQATPALSAKHSVEMIDNSK